MGLRAKKATETHTIKKCNKKVRICKRAIWSNLVGPLFLRKLAYYMYVLVHIVASEHRASLCKMLLPLDLWNRRQYEAESDEEIEDAEDEEEDVAVACNLHLRWREKQVPIFRHSRYRKSYHHSLSSAARRLRDRRIPRVATLSPSSSPWQCLYDSGNEQALVTATGLDHAAFSCLLTEFEPLYHEHTVDKDTGEIRPRKARGGGRPRLLSAAACLGLTLMWTRTRGAEWHLAIVFGTTGTPTSFWVRFTATVGGSGGDGDRRTRARDSRTRARTSAGTASSRARTGAGDFEAVVIVIVVVVVIVVLVGAERGHLIFIFAEDFVLTEVAPLGDGPVDTTGELEIVGHVGIAGRDALRLLDELVVLTTLGGVVAVGVLPTVEFGALGLFFWGDGRHLDHVVEHVAILLQGPLP